VSFRPSKDEPLHVEGCCGYKILQCRDKAELGYVRFESGLKTIDFVLMLASFESTNLSLSIARR